MMKVLLILLPALVQLAVSGTVAQDRTQETCNLLETSVTNMNEQTLTKSEKIGELFGKIELFGKMTPVDSCIRKSVAKYSQAYNKEINFKSCEELRVDASDCMKTNLLYLDCYLKIAKDVATLIHKALQEMTECSSLGNSEFVEDIIKQRSDLEINQTVIDEMEELQRKYSGQSLSL